MERTGAPIHTGGYAGPAQEAAEGFRATMDLTPVGIAHFALDGRFLFANDSLCETLGFACEELLARTFQGTTAPEDIATCMALNAQVACRKRRRYRVRMRFVRADGSIVRCRVSVSAVPQNGAREPDFLAAIVVRHARTPARR